MVSAADCVEEILHSTLSATERPLGRRGNAPLDAYCRAGRVGRAGRVDQRARSRYAGCSGTVPVSSRCRARASAPSSAPPSAGEIDCARVARSAPRGPRTTGALASSPPVAVSTGSDRPAAAASRESARDGAGPAAQAERHRVGVRRLGHGRREGGQQLRGVRARHHQPGPAVHRPRSALPRRRAGPPSRQGARPCTRRPARSPSSPSRAADPPSPSTCPQPSTRCQWSLEVAAERDRPGPRCDDGTGPHATHGADEVGDRVAHHDGAPARRARVHLPQHLVPVGEEEQPPHRPHDDVGRPCAERTRCRRRAAPGRRPRVRPTSMPAGPDPHPRRGEHGTRAPGIRPAAQARAADVDGHDDRHGGEPITSRTGPQPPPTTSRPEPRATSPCRRSSPRRSASWRRGRAR